MKKYIQPLTETVSLNVCTMIAASMTVSNEMGNGWHSKHRTEEEEEEEAYIATEGEGTIQYGDLW